MIIMLVHKKKTLNKKHKKKLFKLKLFIRLVILIAI